MEVGRLVRDKYRIIRLLGEGGMGAVYEATHEMLGTRVALKVLHVELARRTGLAERFLQEARVAAQIKSVHVVHVLDVDRTSQEEGGEAFIVMELLDGEPLSAILDRVGKLPIPTSCEYARQILEALEAAHAIGVIHRDLKPENVFVTHVAGKPVLKLIDFGIAKARAADPSQKGLTVAGITMGTAEYMAPEQARSAAEVDARSDVYSVGVMLFEMLAGQRPVDGDDARIIALKVERGEVKALVNVAPEVPREIAGLVHRMMAARPELRFASAAETRLALEGVMTGQRPPTVPLAALGNAPTARAGQVPPNDTTPGTVREPPVAAAFAMAPSAIPSPPPRPYASEAGGRRRVWPFVVIPLVLGAGAVGAYTWYQNYYGTSDTPAPAPAIATTPTANLEPTATATATTSAPSVPIEPLSPTSPRPQPPRPSPSGSNRPTPPATPSGSPFPPIPSTLPSGFPFPLPSVLPSSFPNPFPSGFPTALPSSFPFPLPGMPSAQPSPVAPSAPVDAGATM